ncbi:MAG: GTPase RsgA, partial [Eubacteriales bacterium]|nr:GTPase RsgA [Eubacteriales bacterium]
MPNGIIVRGVGGFYYVKVGEFEFECKARGIFRKQEMTPLPGDMVEISVVDEDKMQGLIEEILERKCTLIRPAVANINQLITVVATNSPMPDLGLLDRMLVNAEYKGLKSVICVNKIDLGEDVL